MNTPWEDFIYRASPCGIHHQAMEITTDEISSLETWGNEWEANTNDMYVRPSIITNGFLPLTI
jgi:hypothetical protein